AMSETGRRANATMLLTMVLCSVVRATQALAGDQSSGADPAHGANAANSRDARMVSASMFPAPFVSAKPLIDDGFSATEFRPRKHGVASSDAAGSAASII